MIPIPRHNEIDNRLAQAIQGVRAEARGRMVEAMKTYTAEVSRGERYWLIHVPEIDRATQARTVAEIEPITRGLIGVMLQVPEDSFSVNLQLQWPGSAQAHWTRA